MRNVTIFLLCIAVLMVGAYPALADQADQQADQQTHRLRADAFQRARASAVTQLADSIAGLSISPGRTVGQWQGEDTNVAY